MPVILTYVREDRSGWPHCCCPNTAAHVSEDELKQINDLVLHTPEEQQTEGAEVYAPCMTEDTTLPHTLRCCNERTMTKYDITVLNTIYRTEDCSDDEGQGNVAGMLVAVQREAIVEASMLYTQAPHMQSSEKMYTQPFMPPSTSVTWADVLRAVLHEVCAYDAQVCEQWHKACAHYCHTNTEDGWLCGGEGEDGEAVMLMACNVRFVLLPAEARAWLRTCHTEAQLVHSDEQQQRQLPLTAPLYTRAARMTFFDDDIEHCFAYYGTSCLFVYFTLPTCETEGCLAWADMKYTGVCEGEETARGGNGGGEAEVTPADRTLCVTTPPAPLKKAKTCTTTRTTTMPSREAVRGSVGKTGQDAMRTPEQPALTSRPRRLLTELEHAASTHTDNTKKRKKEQCLLWSRAALVRQLRGCHAASLHWQEDIAQDSLDMCEDVDVLLNKLQDMLRSTTITGDCNISDIPACHEQQDERARKAAQLACPAHALGAWQLSLLEFYCDLLLENAAALPTTHAVRHERLLRCAAVGQKVLCVIERLARCTRHAQQQVQQRTTSQCGSFPYDLLLLLLACLRLRTLRHLALLLSASLERQTRDGTTTERESKQRACLLQIRRDALYTTQGLLQQLQPLYESDAYTSSSSSALLFLLRSALPALRPTLRLAALSLTEMAVYLAVDGTQDAKEKKSKKKMQKMRAATVCEPLEVIEAALHIFRLCEEASAPERRAAGRGAPQCVVEALRVMQTRCPASCQPAIAALLLQLLQVHKNTEGDVIQSKTAHTTIDNHNMSDDMPPCIGYTLRTVWSTAAADRLFIRAMLLHDALRNVSKEEEE